ncbi:MAG: phage tail sheath family protein [Eubacteriales bacterium]|nr:phage tail sheath family protein [Eubacteriales bacterium]
MSEKYYHGVRVQEEDSGAITQATGTAGLQVIFGTAPVNLAQDPEAVVNVPVVCADMDEAKKKLGYSDDWASYTLCQAMYASFQMYAVSPVVFINVLDPQKHKKDNAEAEYPVTDAVAAVPVSGVIRSSVAVKIAGASEGGDQTLAEDTDYLLSYTEDGSLLITMVSDTAKAAAMVKVVSSSVDPSVVTEADLIGGYDAVTGKESGLEVLRWVYPKTGMTAGLVSAPGWSHKPAIAAVMMAKCGAINGVFQAMCLLDLDTEQADKYTDAPEYKENIAYTGKNAVVLWPMAKVGQKVMYYSALYGAMVSYTDAANDDVPSISPSNILLGVSGAVTADGTEVYMDREQANTLNGAGVVTLLNETGWRSWGNNTAAFPGTRETKDRWIACKRMFIWEANSLITIYNARVDSPANFRLIESIVDAENIRLNSYMAAGKLAGGKVTYNEQENDIENILDGRLTFRVSIAAWTPAEDILFILKFDPDMLREALAGSYEGGEEA